MKVSFNQLKKLLDSKQNVLHYHDHEFDKLTLKHAHPADRAAYKRGY